MTRRQIETDARDRAWRTFLQGLALDLLVAVAAALLVWLPDADVTSRQAWVVLGVTLTKTILQAAASYVMRLKVAPAGEDA